MDQPVTSRLFDYSDKRGQINKKSEELLVVSMGASSRRPHSRGAARLSRKSKKRWMEWVGILLPPRSKHFNEAASNQPAG